MQGTRPCSSYSAFNLFVATHCWYCGPARDQDDYDKELEYLPCETGKGQSICVAAKRLNQQFYQRLCASKFDYEWNLKTQCIRDEYGYSKSVFCEVGLCIANIGYGGKQQTILMAFCIMYNLVMPSPPYTTLNFKERDSLVS